MLIFFFVFLIKWNPIELAYKQESIPWKKVQLWSLDVLKRSRGWILIKLHIRKIWVLYSTYIFLNGKNPKKRIPDESTIFQLT